MWRQSWRGRLDSGNPFSIQRPQPATFAPSHFLNRRFATEPATTAIAQWATDEIRHVSFAVLRLDEARMAGALQFGIRPLAGAHDVSVRMQLVRAGEVA